MIFIDTNYFLRYLINDLPEQADEVERVFHRAIEGDEVIHTSLVVIFEISWVLRSIYESDKDAVIAALFKILQLPFLQLEEKNICLQALNLYELANLSFEDCYNLCKAKSLGCDTFGSFDKKAVKLFSTIGD